jgi:hypothetical protein
MLKVKKVVYETANNKGHNEPTLEDKFLNKFAAKFPKKYSSSHNVHFFYDLHSGLELFYMENFKRNN